MSASCGIEVKRIIPYKPLLDEACEIATHKPEKKIILQRGMCAAEMKPDVDLDWAELEANAPKADCVTVAATDPLYILYTSGTTGLPKGVVRDNGGHAVALKWSMKHIYNIKRGGCVLGSFGRGLGSGALLHRVRASAHGRHNHSLRGKARGGLRIRELSGESYPSIRSKRSSPRLPRSGPSNGRIRRANTWVNGICPTSRPSSWQGRG